MVNTIIWTWDVDNQWGHDEDLVLQKNAKNLMERQCNQCRPIPSYEHTQIISDRDRCLAVDGFGTSHMSHVTRKDDFFLMGRILLHKNS